MNKKTDEYGFPIPEAFEDEPKPSQRTPKVAPLVLLPLLMMVATGVASAIKFWPQWVDRAQQFALAFERRAERLEQAEQLIRRNPNDLQAYLMRGDEYFARGDYRRAIRDYEHVCRELPGEDAVRRRLATALNNYAYERALAHEDLPQALKDVEHALELVPPNAAFLDTRGYIYFLLHRYDEAQRDLDQAVQLAQEQLRAAHRHGWWHRESSTEFSEILQHRDLLYDEMGRPEVARRDLADDGQP